MNAVSRSGVALIWAILAASAAIRGAAAVVSPPLLVAPADADVQSVARAFHRATGFPLIVVYDGRYVPPGVNLDTPRRMRFLFWSRGQRPVWRPWRSVAAAVGELGPSQLLIFGDTALIPDRWLEGVPRRFPRVRFLGNEDAVGWLNQAQANARRLDVQRRETARRKAALAAQRTTSVAPSAQRTPPARLLALPPVWDVEPPAAKPPEPALPEPPHAAAEPAAIPAPPVMPPEESAPPEPELEIEPDLEETAPAAEEPGTEADHEAAPAPAVPAPREMPAVEPSPAAADEPAMPGPASSYDALRGRFAEAFPLLEKDTGNTALPMVRSHVERTLDWAQQLQLARDGNYPNTALAARDRTQREVDRLRTSLAEYREHSAATSAQIAELKAERLDFSAVAWPSAASDQARAAEDLASFRAARIDIEDLRADPDRYNAVRSGLALEEEIGKRIGAFETAARSFAR